MGLCQQMAALLPPEAHTASTRGTRKALMNGANVNHAGHEMSLVRSETGADGLTVLEAFSAFSSSGLSAGLLQTTHVATISV